MNFVGITQPTSLAELALDSRLRIEWQTQKETPFVKRASKGTTTTVLIARNIIGLVTALFALQFRR